VGIAIYFYEHPSQNSTSAPASTIQEKAPAEKVPAEKVRLIYYQNKISEAWYDKQKLNALLDQCRSDADCTDYVPLTVNNRLRYLEQEKR